MDTPSIKSARTYLDFEGLGQLRGQARQDAGAAVRETARQFEALVIQQMLKSMRATVEKSALSESSHIETFENLFDKEVAMKMAQRGGIGLSEMLIKSMQARAAPAPDNGHGQTANPLQDVPTTTKAFALNPKVTGLPLATDSAKSLPLVEPKILPLEAPPKPLGSDR
jgi:Rod binding domain-containing protein